MPHSTIPLDANTTYAPWVYKLGLRHPYGKCQCGCERDASIARQDNADYGYLKKHPLPYLNGHFHSPPTMAESFWANVIAGPLDACWEWRGSTTAQGYGRIKRHQKTRRAHVVSYELHFGPIPKGLMVCHKCDNPPCVNPKHLFLGTHQDNMDDRNAKGRQARQAGERSATAKLTADQVRQMRAFYVTGQYTLSQLARHFGVSRATVSGITKGKTWRCLA